ncbi:MAG TPA: hypothetical protein VGL40_08285, partial [Bacillota bacterium]
MTRKLSAFNPGDLYHRYQAGETTDEIAASIGVAGSSVRRLLVRHGYVLRSHSEAMRVRNKLLGPAGRRKRTAAAHAAVRGMKRTPEDLARRALGKERTQAHISHNERVLAGLLLDRSVEAVLSKAVGPYNIDLAAYPIAVEVFGGAWHNAGRHAARFEKRTRYLLNAGWHLIVVWVEKARYPLTVQAADYVVSFHNLASRNPSMVRQYRVIRG